MAGIEAARAKYHEGAANMTMAEVAKETAKIKAMVKEVSDMITEGAEDCPDCGNPPVGLFHDGTARPFEIGCVVDRNHRVRESLPEDAVERWNDGDYDPPREEGTVVATHTDATGKVINQQTVKVKKA